MSVIQNKQKCVPQILSKCPSKKDSNLKIQDNNSQNTNQIENYVPRIMWPDLFAQIFLHSGCLYGLYLALTQAKIYTNLWGK
jgi:hypothetical protein